MARIRYLKPEFFKDEDLAELPFDIRLFFAGLWCYADKAGRLEDRPIRLKAEIFPYDQKFDANKALDTLADPKKHSPNGKPFIVRYAINGDRYIQILAWDKHQKPHHTEANSVIPPAPPLKEKEKGNGEGECPGCESSNHEPLRNGAITVKEHNPDDIRLVQLLIDLMQGNNPTSTTIQNLTPERQSVWLRECRLLREKDGKGVEDIEAVIRFSQSDQFWKSNILSMGKLREKWDTLFLKSKKADPTSGIKEWLADEEKKDAGTK